MNDEQKLFIGLIAKADLTAQEFEKRETARNAGLATMRMELDKEVEVPELDKDGKPVLDGAGKPKMKMVPLRESIRSRMTYKVYDKKGKAKGDSFHKDGQEHAIDTNDATSKGYGMKGDDFQEAQRAMADALELVDKLRAQKGPDGEPLFTEADMMDEVFTPLMREGLLPDNNIIDKYSGTDQLLKATFGRYKKAMKDAQDAKAQQRDLDTVDLGGANGKIGQLKALKGKAGEMQAQFKSKLMKKTGISETMLRRMELGKDIYSDVKGFISDNASDFSDVIPDALKNDVQEYLGPIEERLENAEKALGVYDLKGRATEFANDLKDRARELTKAEFDKVVEKVQATRAYEVLNQFAAQLEKKGVSEAGQESLMQKAGDKLFDLASKVEVKLDEIPAFNDLDKWVRGHKDEFTDSCNEVLSSLKEMAGDEYQDVLDLKELNDALEKTDNERAIKVAVRQGAQHIDAAIAGAVSAVNGAAGVAIGGQFVKRAKLDKAEEAAVESPADGETIVDLFATALEATFAAAAPKTAPAPTDGTTLAPKDQPDGKAIFTKMGKAIAAAFRGKANANGLSATMKDNPVAAMATLVKAASAAASKELGTLGDDAPTDGGGATAFKDLVKDPKNQKALLAAGAMPDEDEMEKEMQDDDEKLKDYEDSLMLIDEGGFDAAQSRNIEVLIGELKQNRKTLELAAGLGQGLLSVGASALQPFADTGLGGPALDAIKLAKMIVTLAVNIKKAADRWLLWYKFRSSLEHSKKAVSALTSTIQGFFNNKKEQIAFHTIDDAMQAVQIAFTIVGMVPEPITMGVGKTVNLLAKGTQKANEIAGKIYNEVMLSKAWSTTVKAMNSPGNRKLGLAALRLNPTLGMHAVAWAGAERQPPDPIAQNLMSQLGINAQTIAAGATGDQVKEYLTELLNEDRQLDDVGEVNFDWMPANFDLNAKDFFIVTNRASKLATPKLALAGEKTVIDALKALDKHDPKALQADAERGSLDPTVIDVQVDQAELVCATMRDYVPKTADGTMHEDMSNVLAGFMDQASKHFNEMESLQTLNTTVRTDQNNKLKAVAKTVNSIKAETGKQALEKWAAEATDVINELSGNSTLAARVDVKSMLGDVTRARDDAQERAAQI